MYRDRLRIGLALALGGVLVTGACGDGEVVDDPGSVGGWRTPGCELVRVPEHIKVGDVLMPTTPPGLQAAMARIDKAGRGEFADSYAGLEVDQKLVRAIVYRVPTASFDRFVREAAGNACIVVRDATHSTRDLAAWHDRVLADLPFWGHRGIDIVSIGARHDGTGVEIGTGDVPRTRAELLDRYGQEAPLVFVEHGPVRPLPSQTTPT